MRAGEAPAAAPREEAQGSGGANKEVRFEEAKAPEEAMPPGGGGGSKGEAPQGGGVAAKEGGGGVAAQEGAQEGKGGGVAAQEGAQEGKKGGGVAAQEGAQEGKGGERVVVWQPRKERVVVWQPRKERVVVWQPRNEPRKERVVVGQPKARVVVWQPRKERVVVGQPKARVVVWQPRKEREDKCLGTNGTIHGQAVTGTLQALGAIASKIGRSLPRPNGKGANGVATMVRRRRSGSHLIRSKGLESLFTFELWAG